MPLKRPDAYSGNAPHGRVKSQPICCSPEISGLLSGEAAKERHLPYQLQRNLLVAEWMAQQLAAYVQ